MGWLALAGFSGVSVAAAAEPAEENAKIQALIEEIRTLKDSRFIRNGKEYDAASAAKFVKAKWEANQKDVHTTADFVEKVATKSSTTGKPYLIRFKDGKEIPCAKFLRELKKS